MTSKVTINPNILEMEYAVRGPIPLRAAEMKAAGRTTIPCNIGNPQALGQRPISFYRQVLSFIEHPVFITRERRLRSTFQKNEEDIAEDVLEIAEKLVEGFGAGVGAYTESKGPRFIRESIASFIDRRDGGSD